MGGLQVCRDESGNGIQTLLNPLGRQGGIQIRILDGITKTPQIQGCQHPFTLTGHRHATIGGKVPAVRQDINRGNQQQAKQVVSWQQSTMSTPPTEKHPKTGRKTDGQEDSDILLLRARGQPGRPQQQGKPKTLSPCSPRREQGKAVSQGRNTTLRSEVTSASSMYPMKCRSDPTNSVISLSLETSRGGIPRPVKIMRAQ